LLAGIDRMVQQTTTTALTDWAEFASARTYGVELLRAHFVRHVYERHSHDGYAIGVTESGVQAFTCRGALHASTIGTVMVFNPDEPHDGHAGIPEGFTYRMLYLQPDRVQRILEDARDGRRAALPFARAPLIRDRLLARSVRALHEALSSGVGRLECEARLRDMCLRFAAWHADDRTALREPTPRPNLAALRRVRDFLHASLGDDVTTDDLAGIADMSRFHLCRAFARAYGLPPHAYQLQLRLAEAKRQLAAGQPAAQVAAAIGFADQSHLTKRFKGAFGITPGQFAAASRRRPGLATDHRPVHSSS
jgi:AraC-like DNA-binding protein